MCQHSRAKASGPGGSWTLETLSQCVCGGGWGGFYVLEIINKLPAKKSAVFLWARVSGDFTGRFTGTISHAVHTIWEYCVSHRRIPNQRSFSHWPKKQQKKTNLLKPENGRLGSDPHRSADNRGSLQNRM